ncbi:MAG: ABC transporter ATP-binding protein [Planctomycetota bacterium]|nr:ABC transporter ATP-binding protein [Planctomycetota bacterium]
MTLDNDVMTLDALEFGYEPGRAIVRGLSGRLKAGRLTTLIGPNAAGKSTLMRMMLGQARPWSGAVRLDGEDVASMEARRRASLISYVPQRAGVGFAFSVEEVIEMGRFSQRTGHAAASGASSGAVQRAIEACDLSDLRDRVFTQLSFGQQQRVLLARAMAQAEGRGRVMLLDEPGSAMDLWHVHHMMGWLVRLARSGLGVLVVLHDLNLAARYADEVWLMDGGRLAAEGAWEKVMTPELLEPVYRVDLRPVQRAAGERPVFVVEPREPVGDRL